MSQEKRIRDLEDAVLHLSRAINRIIEAHESGIPPRQDEEPRGLLARQNRPIDEAYQAVQKAVDLMSVKEYE